MPRMFRFKNLAVSVLPAETVAALTDKLKLCIFDTTICLGWTPCHFPSRCHGATWTACWKWVSCPPVTCFHRTCPVYISIDPCPPHTICPGISICPGASCPGASIREFDLREVDPIQYLQQVTELKADLRTALAQVEEHEKTLGDVIKPGSLDEAEQLESELKGALKELDAMKGQLKRKK